MRRVVRAACRRCRSSATIWRCTRATRAISRPRNRKRGRFRRPIALRRWRWPSRSLDKAVRRREGDIREARRRSDRRARRWPPRDSAILPMYEGRFSDAARILQEGATADVAAKNANAPRRSSPRSPHVHLSQENNRAAVAAADQALMRSRAVPIRFLAARTFVETGDTSKARRQARRWRPSSRPSRRPTRRSSRAGSP